MHSGNEKLWHWVIPQLQVQLPVTAQGAALSWMEPWHKETAEWSVRTGIQEKQGIKRMGDLGGGAEIPKASVFLVIQAAKCTKKRPNKLHP